MRRRFGWTNPSAFGLIEMHHLGGTRMVSLVTYANRLASLETHAIKYERAAGGSAHRSLISRPADTTSLRCNKIADSACGFSSPSRRPGPRRAPRNDPRIR